LNEEVFVMTGIYRIRPVEEKIC